MQSDNRANEITAKSIEFFYKVLAGEVAHIYAFKIRVRAYISYNEGRKYNIGDDSFEVANNIIDMIDLYRCNK